MEVNEYLDEAKKKLGITSDYALARILGITTPSMTRYRKHGGKFDSYMCFKIAEILNIDSRTLIAEMQSESEKDPIKQAFWQEQLDIRRVADGTVKIIKGGLSRLRVMPIMLNL